MAYSLGVDIWEGQKTWEPATLAAGGIDYVMVRMNDMVGGHHLDMRYHQHWTAAERFIRIPYFVYNPWVTGKLNFEWLADNLPKGTKAVHTDLEVKYPGYAPSEYAKQYQIYLALVKKYYRHRTYTGGWFLPYLSYWPKDEEYWYARYPFTLYPEKRQPITWPELTKKVQAMIWAPGTTVPGFCRMWQCTHDRLCPPGLAGRPVGLNLWRGSKAELVDWVGAGSAPAQTWQVAVTSFLRKQGYSGPDIA